MKRLLLVMIVVALYLLHQDFWFWRTAQPLVLGFIPIGLFYHACYTVAVSLMMWLLVKHAWPEHLEEGWGDGETGGEGDLAASLPISPSPRLPISAEEGQAH